MACNCITTPCYCADDPKSVPYIYSTRDPLQGGVRVNPNPNILAIINQGGKYGTKKLVPVRSVASRPYTRNACTGRQAPAGYHYVLNPQSGGCDLVDDRTGSVVVVASKANAGSGIATAQGVATNAISTVGNTLSGFYYQNKTLVTIGGLIVGYMVAKKNRWIR